MFGTPRASDENFGWQMPVLVMFGISVLVINGKFGFGEAVMWTAFWTVVGVGLSTIMRSNNQVRRRSMDADLRWAKLAQQVEEARHEEKVLERMGDTVTKVPEAIAKRAA